MLWSDSTFTPPTDSIHWDLGHQPKCKRSPRFRRDSAINAKDTAIIRSTNAIQ